MKKLRKYGLLLAVATFMVFGLALAPPGAQAEGDLNARQVFSVAPSSVILVSFESLAILGSSQYSQELIIGVSLLNGNSIVAPVAFYGLDPNDGGSSSLTNVKAEHAEWQHSKSIANQPASYLLLVSANPLCARCHGGIIKLVWVVKSAEVRVYKATRIAVDSVANSVSLQSLLL